MNAIESLNWRAAIKQFNPERRVSTEDLNVLLDAANLAPTSGGLQPFKIIAVSNQAIKEKLKGAAYGQQQVADASHVLVFAFEKEIGDQTVDRYINRAAEVRGVSTENLKGFSDSMKRFMGNMDDAAKIAWAKSQTYIALGTIMLTAASLEVDTCPMEGFSVEQFEEILGLQKMNLQPAVILPIGYRQTGEDYSKLPKVRRPLEDLVLEVK
mgnify:CR=1 FL=1